MCTGPLTEAVHKQTNKQLQWAHTYVRTCVEFHESFKTFLETFTVLLITLYLYYDYILYTYIIYIYIYIIYIYLYYIRIICIFMITKYIKVVVAYDTEL